MTKNYKLVIFDLDGTLANTSLGVINSVKYTQCKMGLPYLSEEKMYSYVGPPMEESYNRNFGLTGEKLKQAVKYHKEYALAKGYKELTLYDGVYELLVRLRAKNVKTAVATLKAQTTADKIFSEYKLDKLFDIVVGTDSATPKSKAQLLNDCIAATGEDKSDAVLVGDSVYDAIGAEQAGIAFIAVTYGFGFKSEDDLENLSHVAVCDDVVTLSDYLIQ